MSVTHSTRTGKTYYLHAGMTKTGKPKYYFSTKRDGTLVDTIPEGFEVYENIDGQVFLRTITKPTIQPEELSMVQAALLRHGEEWQYKAEIKKDTITVHECGSDIAGLEEMATMYRGRYQPQSKTPGIPHLEGKPSPQICPPTHNAIEDATLGSGLQGKTTTKDE